ncbi:interleukin-1 receptor type 2 [Amia ocellicauda]|uniref:interleukin-1 receptor type 2 n=1 Tax=Amia ocellicauda TaxID=2972642 RepID=UPI003463B27A
MDLLDKLLWASATVLIVCLNAACAYRLPRLPYIEQCIQLPSVLPLYALQGDAVQLKCDDPLSYLGWSVPQGFIYQWIRDGTRVSVSVSEGRVEMQEELLLFLPALTGDSGNYTCILRNDSYCVSSPILLNVYESKLNNLDDISYLNEANPGTLGMVICPDLPNFLTMANWGDLKWFKESTPIVSSEEKTRYKRDEMILFIQDVKFGDEGYYTCALNFSFNNKQLKVTRTIKLQIAGTPTKPSVTHPLSSTTRPSGERIPPKIIYPINDTYDSELGSSLIIPCQVLPGQQSAHTTDVTWLVNGLNVEDFFISSRVLQGEKILYIENGAYYIQVDLIITELLKEDTKSEFKCVAQNRNGYHETTVQINEKNTMGTWLIVGLFASGSFLIVISVVFWQLFKHSNKKDYILTKS